MKRLLNKMLTFFMITGVVTLLTTANVSSYTLTNPTAYGTDEGAGKFIIVVDTTKTGKTDNKSFEIPTIGTGYNYTVEWGDGNIDTGATGDITHTYTTEGIYEIRISGDFPRIYFYKNKSDTDHDKLLDIKQWGDIQWRSMAFAFYACSNLQGSFTDTPNLSSVTSLAYIFHGAKKFKGSIGEWDISNVKYLVGMLSGASEFNEDLNKWDTSNVVNMTSVFNGAEKFNGNIENWNTEKVTTMNSLFKGATSFNQDIGNWSTKNVTRMDNMFYRAYAFDRSLNNWDVGKVFTMENMFFAARNFNGNISNWNTENVENMKKMFYEAAEFNQDISTWNVSNVRNMIATFMRAKKFNSNLSNWNTQNVKIMSDMFNTAVEFNGDISGWDISQVENISYMFATAYKFNQDISSWNTEKVTKASFIFWRAREFNQDISSWNLEKLLEGHGFLYKSGISQENYEKLLIALSNKELQKNVIFGSSSTYCNTQGARKKIIEKYNWNIIDGGLDERSNCIEDSAIRVKKKKNNLNENYLQGDDTMLKVTKHITYDGKKDDMLIKYHIVNTSDKNLQGFNIFDEVETEKIVGVQCIPGNMDIPKKENDVEFYKTVDYNKLLTDKITTKAVDFILNNTIGKPYCFTYIDCPTPSRFGDDNYNCSGLVTRAYREAGIDMSPFIDTTNKVMAVTNNGNFYEDIVVDNLLPGGFQYSADNIQKGDSWLYSMGYYQGGHTGLYTKNKSFKDVVHASHSGVLKENADFNNTHSLTYNTQRVIRPSKLLEVNKNGKITHLFKPGDEVTCFLKTKYKEESLKGKVYIWSNRVLNSNFGIEDGVIASASTNTISDNINPNLRKKQSYNILNEESLFIGVSEDVSISGNITDTEGKSDEISIFQNNNNSVFEKQKDSIDANFDLEEDIELNSAGVIEGNINKTIENKLDNSDNGGTFFLPPDYTPIAPMYRSFGNYLSSLLMLPSTGTRTKEDIYKKLDFTTLSRLKELIKIGLPSKENFRLAGGYIPGLGFWKQVLSDKDRNAQSYIVLPKQGLVMPVSTSMSKEDFINKLENGAVVLPETKTSGYGKDGNIVIVGQSAYGYTDTSRFQAHFQQIMALELGDTVWMYDTASNGSVTRYVYVVNKSFPTDTNNMQVLQKNGKKEITLMTTIPNGRWIVKATMR